MATGADGGDRAAGVGGIVGELIREGDIFSRHCGDPSLGRLFARAAALISWQREALELSRVWWDETASPYHGGWHHAGGPCDRNPCAACRARAAIAAIVGEAGRPWDARGG